MYPTRVLRSHGGPEHNITGFDLRAFHKASNGARYDPWERYEAWRYQGYFTRWSRLRNGLPGLGIATVAFAAYCGYEYMFLSDDHGHGHADEHH